MYACPDPPKSWHEAKVGMPRRHTSRSGGARLLVDGDPLAPVPFRGLDPRLPVPAHGRFPSVMFLAIAMSFAIAIAIARSSMGGVMAPSPMP